MQLERKPTRTINDTENHRLRGGEGQPVNLVEMSPLTFKPEPPKVDSDRRGWLEAAMSGMISGIMDSFAFCSAGMYPEVYHSLVAEGHIPGHDQGRLAAPQISILENAIFPFPGSRDGFPNRSTAKVSFGNSQQEGGVAERPAELDAHAGTDPASSTATGRGSSILSMLASPWRVLTHASEIRRMRMALEALDDRTLKDIGLSRCSVDAVVRRGRLPD
ncbi:DUF1127 domain-containing protein [Neorhizobium sp. P12A]|uniref:DUF1127 domain-containing protein n=1 Tax=Neorhizobium sp. P12A TaxID=2268027 RepID=UPI0011EE4268|nr:DUF1127 domain-containing protein [Neorhizobium sp. P12A]KAA0690241.1 DUF1127 domain-containing protein [Neorhizobium sp. P12A]